MALVDAALVVWSSKHAVVKLDKWMLPSVIGKGGTKLKELEKASSVSIDIDKEASVAKIKGQPENVAKAKSELEQWVEVLGVGP